MATPGRTRVISGAAGPVVPAKKKRGPKPGTKYKKKALDGLDLKPGKIEVVSNPGVPRGRLREGGPDPSTRLNRVVEVLTSEYSRLQEARDAAQAKMDYLDSLYQHMTEGGGHLSTGGA